VDVVPSQECEWEKRLETQEDNVQRGDWLVRGPNGLRGIWGLTVWAVTANASDEGTAGSRTKHGNRSKIAKHKKYMDDRKLLNGFALDTCGGMHVEANEAVDLWSKEVLGAHNTNEDDQAFFGARMRQCISMKLKEDKVMSIMEVLSRARANHVYPQKGETMLAWPTLGRDGVVSDEPIGPLPSMRKASYGRIDT
jgi:hypothetical protein